MSGTIVIMTITRMEATHLSGLVAQFEELLEATGDTAGDPAMARLVPDAYPDDAEAARDFRRATERELLDRRAADAGRVRASLATLGDDDDTDPASVVDLALDEDEVRAWMRTLTAIRLVIASRLGIETEDDHDDEDPRYGVYDWLGYRLDGLIHAADELPR